MNFILRKTKLSDLSKVLEIYSNARAFMRNNGNPTQWEDYWPPEDLIRDDIKEGISYVVTNKENEILGVFSFSVGIDPTYINIRDGKWLSDKTYGTIHHLASSFKYKGIFSFVQKELEKKFKVNFRIDTHENNIPMRKVIERNGYIYCGHISPVENLECLAFEKVII